MEAKKPGRTESLSDDATAAVAPAAADGSAHDGRGGLPRDRRAPDRVADIDRDPTASETPPFGDDADLPPRGST